jgi:hypothetical protein
LKKLSEKYKEDSLTITGARRCGLPTGLYDKESETVRQTEEEIIYWCCQGYFEDKKCGMGRHKRKRKTRWRCLVQERKRKTGWRMTGRKTGRRLKRKRKGGRKQENIIAAPPTATTTQWYSEGQRDSKTGR